MRTTVHEGEHQGIATSWVELPGTLSGTLVFGVGQRHEPPHLAGITHLAEHLIFRAMGPIVPSHDGLSTANAVEFFADGDPEEVAGFLNRVATAIRERPFTEADLDLEKRVIEAERPAGALPGRGLLTVRYGIESVGKAHAGDSALWSIGLDEVRDWIGRWFVVENAHLNFTGPLPPGLDVSLGTGQRAVGPSPTSIIQTPVLVASTESGVALSVVVEPDLAPFLRDVLAEELMDVLRTQRGLVYGIDPRLTLVDEGRCVVDVVIEPPEEFALVARLAVETLRNLARSGPSDHAIAVARSSCRSRLAHPVAWSEYLDARSAHQPLGIDVPDPDAMRARVAAVEPSAITAAFARAFDSVIVMVDEIDCDPAELAQELELALAEPTLGSAEPGRRRGPGRLWLGAFGSIWRNWCRLDGSTLWWTERGATRRVELGDIVVAGRFADGGLVLVDRQGCSDVLLSPLWIGGLRLVAAILEHLPEQVVRDFSWHDARPEHPAPQRAR